MNESEFNNEWDITSNLLNDTLEQLAKEELDKKAWNVRLMLMKQKKLMDEKDNTEKALSKIIRSLSETNDKIEKFKKWDWSVLLTFNQQEKKPNSLEEN